VGGVIRRCITFDFVIFVGDEVDQDGPTEAGIVDGLRLNGRVIKRCAAAFEEGADVVSEPERGEDGGHGPVSDQER